MDNNYGDNKIEFRGIILRHIEKILDMSTHELRDKSTSITKGNFSDTIINENTKVSYIQAVECLAYALLPYFDDKMKKVYDKNLVIMNSLGFEIRDILRDEYDRYNAGFVEEYGTEQAKDKIRGFTMYMRMHYAKGLFVELMKMMHRVKYLQSTIYGEDKDEVVLLDGGDGEK